MQDHKLQVVLPRRTHALTRLWQAVEPGHLHNLTWDASKRRWKIRITLDIGKKVVGKRVTIHLPEMDVQMAIFSRDLILNAYRQIGIKVNVRTDPKIANPVFADMEIESEGMEAAPEAPTVETPEPEIEPEPVPAVPERSPLDWGSLRGKAMI